MPVAPSAGCITSQCAESIVSCDQGTNYELLVQNILKISSQRNSEETGWGIKKIEVLQILHLLEHYHTPQILVYTCIYSFEI